MLGIETPVFPPILFLGAHTHRQFLFSEQYVQLVRREEKREGEREGGRTEGTEGCTCSLSFDPLLRLPSPSPSLPFPPSLPPPLLGQRRKASACPTRESIDHADGLCLSALSFPSPSCPPSLLSFLPTPFPSSLPSPVPSSLPRPINIAQLIHHEDNKSVNDGLLNQTLSTFLRHSLPPSLPPSSRPASQHAHVHLVPKGPPFRHLLLHKTMSSHTSCLSCYGRVECRLEESI